jgi:DNA-binding transcriptional MerR regulator
MQDLMNIHQLVAAAAAALSQAALTQTSGRVVEVPQVRTVRFYTTHGLIDPPAAFEGRRALYAERHLLQLVAIKQLQARGMELDAIQTQLLGASDEALAKLADIARAALPSPSMEEDEAEDDNDQSFWRQEPAEATAHAEARASPQRVDAADLLSMAGVRLAPGLLLLLEQPARALHPDDAAALRAAAAPLLHMLRTRKLVSE